MLLILVAAGAFWWWRDQRAAAAALQVAAADPGALVARLAAAAMGGPGDAPPLAVSATAPAARPVDPDDPCDIRRFAEADAEIGADGHRDGPKFRALGGEMRDTLQRTLAGLKAQPDDAQQATAALLQLWAASDAAAQAQAEAWQREGIDCAVTPQRCGPPPADAATLQAQQALVQRAVNTTDPWVYSLAATRCRGGGQAQQIPACQMISLQRWAQLDGDNAVPWLFMAAEAKQAQDAAALDEAMHRVAQSRRLDVRFGRGVDLLAGQLPEGASPYIGTGFMVGLIGMDSAVALPGYSAVSEYCSAKAVSEPSRREVCNGVAGALTERSTSLLDMAIGLRIARRLDWPAVRLAPLQEQHDAVMHELNTSVPAAFSSGHDAQACVWLQRQTAMMRDIGRVGELQASLQRVDATPLGRAGHAALFRAERAAAAASAAAAAATAAVASAPRSALAEAASSR